MTDLMPGLDGIAKIKTTENQNYLPAEETLIVRLDVTQLLFSHN